MKLPPELRARWDQLAPREKNLGLLAAALIGAALLWWLGLAPAWQTLRSAEARHRGLDAQLQRMLRLQAQAQLLQSQPRLGHDEALRALEASVRQGLGASAQLSVVGERATVTLKGTSADALAQWLSQVRINARALPTEARLVRTAAPADAGAPAGWSGTLVLSLPTR